MRKENPTTMYRAVTVLLLLFAGAAAGMLAPVPAAAQSPIWEATLNAGPFSGGSVGCFIFGPLCTDPSVLSNDEFTFQGATYTIETAFENQGTFEVGVTSPGLANLDVLDPFVFCIDTRALQFSSASHQNFITTATWVNANVGLSSGNQYNLSIRSGSSCAPAVVDTEPTVSASCEPCVVGYGGEVRLTAESTTGLVRGRLTYQWTAPKGRLTDAAKATARWRAPNEMGRVAIRVRVSDGSASASTVVHVDVDPTAAPALPLGGALLLGLLLAWRGAVRVRRRDVWQA